MKLGFSNPFPMRVRAKLLSEAQEADEAMKAWDVAFLLRLSKPEVSRDFCCCCCCCFSCMVFVGSLDAITLKGVENKPAFVKVFFWRQPCQSLWSLDISSICMWNRSCSRDEMSQVCHCPSRKSLPCCFGEASRELAEGLAEARASQQSEARKAQVEAVWPPGPPLQWCCFFMFNYSMHVEYVTKATPWYKREIWSIRLLLLQICSTALQRLRPLPRNVFWHVLGFCCQPQFYVQDAL